MESRASALRQRKAHMNQAKLPPHPPAHQRPKDAIAIDGFTQVLEMLKIADPAFRESLLQRLAAKDQKLARSLRADLGLL